VTKLWDYVWMCTYSMVTCPNFLGWGLIESFTASTPRMNGVQRVPSGGTKSIGWSPKKNLRWDAKTLLNFWNLIMSQKPRSSPSSRMLSAVGLCANRSSVVQKVFISRYTTSLSRHIFLPMSCGKFVLARTKFEICFLHLQDPTPPAGT
jgi:hypothetical protein